jgi:hypothetical protein
VAVQSDEWYDFVVARADRETLPFVQHDKRWAKKRIWNRAKVAQAVGSKKAGELLEAGTTFQSQGCQLCCIAMILRLLDVDPARPWDPPTVLRAARREFIGDNGVSMVPLYADLCADLTRGRVQLLAKEYYAAGGTQPRLSQVGLVRAYRALPGAERARYVLMLRLGTDDETVASHYLLLAPTDDDQSDSDNVVVLDPDMADGADAEGWTFLDAWDRFMDVDADGGERARLVEEDGVRPGQVAAVYLFGRRAEDDYDAVLSAFR